MSNLQESMSMSTKKTLENFTFIWNNIIVYDTIPFISFPKLFILLILLITNSGNNGI